jgi:D-3-phosphoglycerate dehydrogenase
MKFSCSHFVAAPFALRKGRYHYSGNLNDSERSEFMKLKVVLAGNYPAGTFEKLAMALPQEKFLLAIADTVEKFEAVTDADILILRTFGAAEDVMACNKNLKMIMRWGAGYDSVDIREAGARGILVTNTPGANAYAVSELAVLLMLAVGRRLFCHNDSLKAGQWSKNTFLDKSFSLNNKLVGIIGGGNIGRQVAQKVQVFGATVQYYDPFRLPESTEQVLNMAYVSLEQLIATSDIVTLHVPLTEENRHMIGKEQIDAMKTDAILINVARGGLVDDDALLAAVQSGHLLGAGIDCVEHEPLPMGHPMLENPNIIITPHIGGGTCDLATAIIPMLVEDIISFAEKKTVAHVVNGLFLHNWMSSNV